MGLIVMCGAVLAGVALGDVWPLSAPPLVACAALAAIAAGLSWRSPPSCTLALAVCALALGAVRATLPAVPGPPPPGALIQLRSEAAERIASNLPEPQASLATGVLLGGTGHLDAVFKRQLQRSGLTHVLAIDGYKEIVVGAAVAGVAVWLLGARLAILPTVAAIGGYTLLTGAHPSAVRAGLMVGLAQVAAFSGRVPDSLSSLLLAVTLMAALDPRVLLQVGLQLSVAAVLGIVLLWPRLLRRPLRRLPHVVAEPLGLTLAVTLATLPVALAVFQVVSLVSPLAHVLAVPLLPAVLVGGGLLALLAPVPLLGPAAAWLAWLPTTLLTWCVQFFGNLPGAAVSTGRLSLGAAACLAVGLLAWGMWHQPELRLVRRRAALWHAAHRQVVLPVACMSACLGSAALLALLRPDGQLHVDQLALDRGSAVFVRGPGGRTALLVSGPADAVALVDQVADHLRVWEHKLDAVVACDTQAERSLGLTLARYPADQLIRGAPPSAVDVGGGAVLTIAARDGQLAVQAARLAPTTSAARPGSAG